MKKKFGDILISLIMLGIGVSLFLWAEKVTETVAIVFGCGLILYGLINGIGSYKSEQKDTMGIAVAVTCFVVGLILVIRPNIISEVISFVIGIYILISGIMKLKITMDNKSSSKFKVSLWLGIAEIVIGILCILGKLLIPNIVLKFVGILLIVFGLVNIASTIVLPKIELKK